MAVLDALFGWRKASRCKKLIRRVQCRIRILRNKRDSIVRQSKSDVSRLVQMGYHDIATQRAEQLLKDESMMELYDLLNHFSEFIVTNLSYIRQHRECPNDVNEAVSSLIFASARCGELPELLRIRELFRERYGECFARTAVNLLPGNRVNSKIRDHLSLKSISDDSKFKRVDEFARDLLRVGGQPEILAIEYASELHKQIEEMAERQAIEDLEEEDVAVTELQQRDTSAEHGFRAAKLQFRSSRVSAPFNLRTASSCSEEKERGIGSEQGEGTVSSSSSAASSPHFADLKVVYHDDVEELQSRDGEGLVDQMFFKFKPPVVPKTRKPGKIASDGCTKPDELSEKEDLSPGKRLSWRPVSREPESKPDSEYASYYNARNGNPRKHLKQSPTDPQPGKVIAAAAAQPESHCSCCAHSKYPNHARIFRGQPDASPDHSLYISDASTSSDSEEDIGLVLPSYSRAMTLPPKRQTSQPAGDRGSVPRSNSCPYQPHHVHPMLPDYEELSARFSALKKENRGTRTKKNRL